MNPWIDANDLIWIEDLDRDSEGNEKKGIMGHYTWRDTNIHMYLHNETMEIMEIWAEGE